MTFMKVTLDGKASLQRLHQLILMHIPGSMTDGVKSEMADIIKKSLEGEEKCIL